MELPIGLLIYWTTKLDENHSMLSGMWYYKEMYVPTSLDEKKNSILDLKKKRCTVLNIHGTYGQILDILSQGDRFKGASNFQISQLNDLIEKLNNSPVNKAYLFDDIYNINGTSLMVDTIIEVEESMDNINNFLQNGKVVDVNISENWSYEDEFIKAMKC